MNLSRRMFFIALGATAAVPLVGWPARRAGYGTSRLEKIRQGMTKLMAQVAILEQYMCGKIDRLPPVERKS